MVQELVDDHKGLVMAEPVELERRENGRCEGE
jgi:hypothetical protein